MRQQRPGLSELPPEVVERLGTMPDRALAEEAGVHPNTILNERRSRGIPSFRRMSSPVEWTPEMIRKLGSATDREVAAELGVSYSAVARKRRLLGIPPFHVHVSHGQLGYDWQPEEIALLGKVSDGSLARELGLSTSTVAIKRTQLGIPPWRPRPPKITWTKAMLRLLGRVPDEEIARRFGISGSSVIQKRRRLGIPPVVERRPVEHTPELLEALKLPLSEACRRTGLNVNSVLALKKKYGIRSPRASELRYGPEVVKRMGREPDSVIAADLGVNPSAVRYKRKRLGIPAYDGHRRRRR